MQCSSSLSLSETHTHTHTHAHILSLHCCLIIHRYACLRRQEEEAACRSSLSLSPLLIIHRSWGLYKIPVSSIMQYFMYFISCTTSRNLSHWNLNHCTRNLTARRKSQCSGRLVIHVNMHGQPQKSITGTETSNLARLPAKKLQLKRCRLFHYGATKPSFIFSFKS